MDYISDGISILDDETLAFVKTAKLQAYLMSCLSSLPLIKENKCSRCSNWHKRSEDNGTALQDGVHLLSHYVRHPFQNIMDIDKTLDCLEETAKISEFSIQDYYDCAILERKLSNLVHLFKQLADDFSSHVYLGNTSDINRLLMTGCLYQNDESETRFTKLLVLFHRLGRRLLFVVDSINYNAAGEKKTSLSNEHCSHKKNSQYLEEVANSLCLFWKNLMTSQTSCRVSSEICRTMWVDVMKTLQMLPSHLHLEFRNEIKEIQRITCAPLVQQRPKVAQLKEGLKEFKINFNHNPASYGVRAERLVVLHKEKTLAEQLLPTELTSLTEITGKNKLKEKHQKTLIIPLQALKNFSSQFGKENIALVIGPSNIVVRDGMAICLVHRWHVLDGKEYIWRILSHDKLHCNKINTKSRTLDFVILTALRFFSLYWADILLSLLHCLCNSSP